MLYDLKTGPIAGVLDQSPICHEVMGAVAIDNRYVVAPTAKPAGEVQRSPRFTVTALGNANGNDQWRWKLCCSSTHNKRYKRIRISDNKDKSTMRLLEGSPIVTFT